MKHLRHIVAIFLAGTALLFFSAPAGADLLVEMDNDGTEATLLGAWGTSTAKILYQGDNYRFAFGVGGAMTSQGFWTSPIGYENDGEHCVYAKWSDSPNRATNARYEIDWDGGTTATFAPQTISVQNQQVDGGTWVRLACSSIGSPGQRPIVRLSNFGVAANRVVIFDGIMITREQVDRSGIIDEPGYELAQSGGSGVLAVCSGGGAAWTTLRTITLVTPSNSGIVWVHANGISRHFNAGITRVCIASTGNCTSLAPIIDQSNEEVAQGDARETRWTVSDTFPATGGAQTFLLKGCRNAATDNVDLLFDDFVGLYFPTHY